MRVRAYAFKQGEPPSEVQLWTPGENPTDYGVHRWTERSAELVSAEYAARGNPLQVDIEHNCADGKANAADPPQTGGYAKFEVRNGAPWLTFDWSAVATEQIRTRQRLFLSPEYEVDKTTGEIVRLIRVSLVGDPGTHHARMLANAKAAVRAERNAPMDLSMVLAALRAALAAEDPAVAKDSITNLVAEIEKSQGGGGEPPAVDLAAAADDKPPTDPQQTSADDDPSKKKDEPVAAKVAASKPAAPPTKSVDPAVSKLTADFDSFKRDTLLKESGHRLQESQRVWASRQPYAIVKGLIDSTDDKEPTIQASARPTRPPQQKVEPRGLPEKEGRDLARAMGLRDKTLGGPRVSEDGTLVIHTARPSDHEQIQAAAKQARAALNGGE